MTAPAVVFDVGNVLIDWDARRVYRDCFDDDAAIEDFFREIDFNAWNLAQDAGRSWAEGVACLSVRHPHRADLIARFDRDWQTSVSGAIQGSVRILETLRELGTPLYAITNFSAEKWAEACDRFAFLRQFRDAVVSAHEGVVKPDPAIFAILLERNQLDAGDCIFIDDSPANVAVAEALGFDAILFEGSAQLAGKLRARGFSL